MESKLLHIMSCTVGILVDKNPILKPHDHIHGGKAGEYKTFFMLNSAEHEISIPQKKLKPSKINKTQMFVCFDALLPSQQYFSHAWMFSHLHGLN